MKRILLLFSLVGALLCPGAALSAEDPARYVVTIRSLELKDSRGQWVTILEPDRMVDLVKERPQISYYNNEGRIPAGRYVNFRLKLATTLKVAGADGPYHTRESGSVTLYGEFKKPEDFYRDIRRIDESVKTTNAESEGPIHVRYEPDGRYRDAWIEITALKDLRGFIIQKSTYLHVEFSLDFKNSLRYLAANSVKEGIPKEGVLIAMLPDKASALSITAGEESVEIGREEIQMEFKTLQ